MTVRERIARLYAAHPRGERAEPEGRRGRPHEGQVWLAGEIKMHPATIRRWVAQDRIASRLGKLEVERLEREAGLRNGGPAQGDGA